MAPAAHRDAKDRFACAVHTLIFYHILPALKRENVKKTSKIPYHFRLDAGAVVPAQPHPDKAAGGAAGRGHGHWHIQPV